MGKYGFGEEEGPVDPPAAITLPKPKKKSADKPSADVVREAARAGEKLGFVSREPAAKPPVRKAGRRKLVEEQDKLFIAGPLRVLQAFREYCDQEQLQNYWTGLERLLQQQGKPKQEG